MPKKKQKRTIGRTDKVDFPELALYDLDAKIDTGAYTCSLHCTRIKQAVKNGKPLIGFNLLDPSHPKYQQTRLYIANFEQRRIKNSFGQSEKRFIIKTSLLLFGKIFQTEFSLTNRGNMKYPVLIGRKFLQHGFVVDVAKYNLSYKKKQAETDAHRNTVEK